jgi:hypothetical protein
MMLRVHLLYATASRTGSRRSRSIYSDMDVSLHDSQFVVSAPATLMRPCVCKYCITLSIGQWGGVDQLVQSSSWTRQFDASSSSAKITPWSTPVSLSSEQGEAGLQAGTSVCRTARSRSQVQPTRCRLWSSSVTIRACTLSIGFGSVHISMKRMCYQNLFRDRLNRPIPICRRERDIRTTKQNCFASTRVHLLPLRDA